MTWNGNSLSHTPERSRKKIVDARFVLHSAVWEVVEETFSVEVFVSVRSFF